MTKPYTKAFAMGMEQKKKKEEVQEGDKQGFVVEQLREMDISLN